MLMRWSLLWLLAVAAFPLPAVAQTLVTAAQVGTTLGDIAQGRDKSFTEPTALAWSLDTGRALADRIAAINTSLAQEVERVTGAFVGAASADKISATKAMVATIDARTAQDGAGYVFSGSGPSLAFFRQLLFVPASNAGTDPVDAVMSISSRFVRSPKTVDYYYEYSDPTNLKQSSVVELAGSGTSWTTGARPPMTTGSVYALKKCRDIFILGWFCTTSLYQVRDLPGSGGTVKLLLTGQHALPAGTDNAEFDDDRGKNAVDGYTALYVVMASGGTVLVYNVGAESVNGSLSVQGKLSDALREQHAQLASRISAELKIDKLPY